MAARAPAAGRARRSTLCAAADDLELPTTRPLAEAVADRMAELLALAGYELVRDPVASATTIAAERDDVP